MDLCTKKLGMQIELHRNNVYQGVELLLLVSMLFLLAIPKCLLIFKENFYYTIRRHGSDVYLGMCPIKMAAPILMYYGASAKLAKRRRRRTIEGYG